MSFFVQHGYGKADKLHRLADRGHITGAILSPADETRSTLAQTVRDMRARGIATGLDPQTYVYSITGAVARCHDEFGLDFGPLNWGSLDARAVARHVASVVEANRQLAIDGPTIAPTVRQLSFADPWTPFAIQYARETLSAAAPQTVFASLLIEEAGLSDWTAIRQWLDVATTLDVAGFYIVFGRRGNYPTAWDSGLLTNALRLVYRLAVLNEFRVWVGYADAWGLGAIAMGADVMASGWSYRQRNFVAERWVPAGGGSAASPRVTSQTLLSPLLAIGEADVACRSTQAADVLDDPFLRRRIADAAASWTNPEGQVQHLETLSRLTAEIEAAGDVASRLDLLASRLNSSTNLMQSLSREGVALAGVHGRAIASIATAIGNARRAEGI
jgi:hypothetical protein